LIIVFACLSGTLSECLMVLFVLVDQLLLAVKKNDVAGVKLLLDGGGCKNLLNQEENKNGLSPLMIAAFKGTYMPCVGIPQQQPHHRSGLATLPAVGAVP